MPTPPCPPAPRPFGRALTLTLGLMAGLMAGLALAGCTQTAPSDTPDAGGDSAAIPGLPGSDKRTVPQASTGAGGLAAWSAEQSVKAAPVPPPAPPAVAAPAPEPAKAAPVTPPVSAPELSAPEKAAPPAPARKPLFGFLKPRAKATEAAPEPAADGVQAATVDMLPGPATPAPDRSAAQAADLDPKAQPEEADDAPPLARPEPVPDRPEAEKSAAQKACEKKGGTYSRLGGAFLCVRTTRDGGKACRTGRDCQGECLARSMTCAPLAPLLGCNEVVQDNGVRTTLCIE